MPIPPPSTDAIFARIEVSSIAYRATARLQSLSMGGARFQIDGLFLVHRTAIMSLPGAEQPELCPELTDRDE